MSRALALAALLGSLNAFAHAVSLETSAARGALSALVSAELELQPDQTFLSLCYGFARPSPVEGLAEGVPSYQPSASQQLCASIDRAFGRHWYAAAVATVSPRSVDRVSLFTQEHVALVSSRQSLGATLALAYDSAGLSGLEGTLDAALSASGYQLGRGITLGTRTQLRTQPLLSFRGTAGGSLRLESGVELTAHGTYVTYSADPLTAGRFTEEELALLESRLVGAAREAGLRFEEIARHLELLEDRLVQADAVSGYAAAPLWFELRAGVSYRFGAGVRGQLAYAFDRYVASEGFAHVLSTKWTFRLAEAWRAWAALALQREVPQNAAPASYGLLTLGAEFSF